MITLKCKDCGKKWTGHNEHEAETMADFDPCPCEKEAAGMSLEELKKKVVTDDELDEMLEDAAHEASFRGETEEQEVIRHKKEDDEKSKLKRRST